VVERVLDASPERRLGGGLEGALALAVHGRVERSQLRLADPGGALRDHEIHGRDVAVISGPGLELLLPARHDERQPGGPRRVGEARRDRLIAPAPGEDQRPGERAHAGETAQWGPPFFDASEGAARMLALIGL